MTDKILLKLTNAVDWREGDVVQYCSAPHVIHRIYLFPNGETYELRPLRWWRTPKLRAGLRWLAAAGGALLLSATAVALGLAALTVGPREAPAAVLALLRRLLW